MGDILIVESGEAGEAYLEAFAMDKIRDYRRREIHGNAYRHLDKYRLLVSEERNEPFIRLITESKSIII